MSIPKDLSQLNSHQLAEIMGLYLSEIMVHYGLWFTESVRINGLDETLKMENEVARKFGPIAIKRLADHFGLKLDGNIPVLLKDKSPEDLRIMISDIAKLWLAADGVWFQAVEAAEDMVKAKQVNDTCWFSFGKLEAYKAKTYLEMPEHPGIEGLKAALNFRMYASINAHSMEVDDTGALIYSMNDCRVQSARKRKNMEPYPCKSGGTVEYTQFALGVDSRIKTECMFCPPDRIPEEAFCRWRFSIE